MKRIFDEHIKRKVSFLDGAWKFSTDPDNKGLAEKWYKGLPDSKTVIVPSVWNTQLGLLEYEGVAWYQKKIHSFSSQLRFVFEGVLTQTDVWLDDEHIGSHYGGFCPFDIVVKDVKDGEHILTVRADNSFDDHSIPLALTDWWHYGGISRSVSMEELNGLCALNNRFDCELSDDLNNALCRFTAEIYNASGEEVCSAVKFLFDGKVVCEKELCLKPYESRGVSSCDFNVEKPRLWSPDTPELYEIALVTDTDDLYDRVGIRKVEVEGTKLLLNKKPFEVRGVNRHEENTDFGFAFPPALMKRDIDILTNMNANSVRGSHYPNAPIFLDMLDEEGLTFWSEIPMWGNAYTPEMLADPEVLRRALEMHREMLKWYYNHPSIIIWGMFNENPSQFPETRVIAEKLYKHLKENGGNRLVTYACNKIKTCICMDIGDILCINHYDGWYSGDRDSWKETCLAVVRNRMEELGVKPKPIIMSEFGCAAIYGNHTLDDIKWTEEYQAELMEKALKIFRDDPWVVGYYIWQFCDIRTHQRTLDRARKYNNKGILNEYRKPKMAYFAVKRTYGEFAKKELE
jgi:beta-glucuronidase